MEKLIKNGRVAVIISAPYGAGWSTWNLDHPEMLFDPTIVDLVLSSEGKSPDELSEIQDKILHVCALKYPDAYCSAVDELQVVWIPVGTKFIVEENDGSETIVYENDLNWITA